ncbi:hypothetical protein AAFF_G00323540 [Aldrovandia affinis]|uniref:Uncharacterized protein n=1 Tax=Aldrovandia affinis TaxID=143900 RepID=A0AAD7R6S2_9TELE|nr:hypothetical protein AAFF_G00323540 [Aldrovandia affinis]
MKDESEWPERPDQSSHVQEDDVEIKRAAVVSLIATDENIATVNKLIDHYSSWHQLKKAVGWFLRLKKLLLHPSGKRKELQATISQSEDDTVKQEALLNPLRHGLRLLYWLTCDCIRFDYRNMVTLRCNPQQSD